MSVIWVDKATIGRMLEENVAKKVLVVLCEGTVDIAVSGILNRFADRGQTFFELEIGPKESDPHVVFAKANVTGVSVDERRVIQIRVQPREAK